MAVAEGEAGAEQGAFQALAIAYANAAAVHGCTAATAGGKFFLADRIENDRMLKATAVFAGNAHGEMRHAAHEVGGAIERVDDPQVILALALTFAEAAFLTVDTVVRIGLAQCRDDGLLSRTVYFGDVVLGVLLVDGDGVQALDGTKNQFTGAAGRAQRDIQHGLHGNLPGALKKADHITRKA